MMKMYDLFYLFLFDLLTLLGRPFFLLVFLLVFLLSFFL